jgi:NAD kinase
MPRRTEHKIILVTRRTRLDDLIARFNTAMQAQFYVEHLGADFSDYLSEHECYRRSVAEAEDCLQELGRVQSIDRAFLPNFIFGPHDTVVAIGQDGLVANTLKYLSNQPLIGVNPDPHRWEGVLLPFKVADLPQIVPEVFAGKHKIQEVTMARVELNNGQILYGVNDIFVGPKSHTSARYILLIGSEQEQQSSSGLIVSTGLGATGWFKSLLAGASGITTQLLQRDFAIRLKSKFTWDANYLYFTVREPFPSKTSSAKLVFGKITPENSLKLVSQMPENGIIFSDGIEADFLEFNSGTEATISVADKKGHLVS